jgi:SAM-dependent methyltransferase
MKLNLGCGRSTLYGWTNVDRIQLPGVDVVADLNTALPFDDDSADEILLSHTLEHIQNTLPLMEELHRVAKPDALLVVAVPYGTSDDAWEDPTHVRPYFLGSFNYFSQPFYWKADYGFRGDWKTEEIVIVADDRFRGKEPAEIARALHTERNVAREMVVSMRAIKPIREPLRELQEPNKITVIFQGDQQP